MKSGFASCGGRETGFDEIDERTDKMSHPLTRRTTIALGAGGLIAGLVAPASARTIAPTTALSTERWSLSEVVLTAETQANPFDVELSAAFTDGRRTIAAAGFYDGDGTWRIRFSPPDLGLWRWVSNSDLKALDGQTGAFEAIAPAAGNHGPVAVVETFHFAYADGTPFRQVGTTSYGWTHQPEARRRETLATLAGSPFDKIRMLVFPNASVKTNDALAPFEKTGPGDKDWDLTRFNPAFFQRLDACVAALCGMGIEADVILFHPYDGQFGFDEMPAEADDRYVRYVVARLSAYRNVWWSLANEFDVVKAKTTADFDRLGQLVQARDPHGRLRSIHNWRVLFDNGKSWVTHASIQDGSAVVDDARAVIYRDVWRKPVVFDEVRYEGNIGERWGNLTGPQLVRAFWQGLVAGAYVGHSETFDNPQDDYWLGAGGSLRGESAPRLAFLKSIMEAGPTPGFDPIDKWWDRHVGGKAGQFYLRYFGEAAPEGWAVDIPRDELKGGERFTVDVIDTWNMTIDRLPDVFTLAEGESKYTFRDPDRPIIPLPLRQWMAVRFIRTS